MEAVIRFMVTVSLLASCGTAGAASAAATPSLSPLGACGTYAPPPQDVGAEIQHLKTAAAVIEVISPCTLRVRISGGGVKALAPFNDKVIVLRAMQRTTFKSAPAGDLGAIGRFGLKPGDVFTLSFDSRPFPDGSYPLNFMNW
jgi:hypothetical protein